MIQNDLTLIDMKVPILTPYATPDEILEGEKAYSGAYDNLIVLTGTMPNKGNQSATLNCGESYTIPLGYHAGDGKITANSLTSQTSGTAAASNIQSGYTAWVNGSKITGNYVPVSNEGKYVYKKYTIGLQFYRTGGEQWYNDDGWEIAVSTGYTISGTQVSMSGTITKYTHYNRNGYIVVDTSNVKNLIGKYYGGGNTIKYITNAEYQWDGYAHINIYYDEKKVGENIAAYGVMDEDKWSSETKIGNYYYKKCTTIT